MKPTCRIISLAPGQTEVLAALGLAAELEGITEHCDFPPEIRRKRIFGSWFAPDLNGVLTARPDLVCTFGRHQEEARDVLREGGLQVFHGDPETVEASLAEMLRLADLTDRRESGETLVTGLAERLGRIRKRVEAVSSEAQLSVFRIMNWDPLISVGPGAFQHDVIHCAGGRNALGDATAPYPGCTPEAFMAIDPDAVFFCEPFIRSMLLGEPRWANLRAVRNDRVLLFDCGLTCRSGPRILDMVEALAAALYPRHFAGR